MLKTFLITISIIGGAFFIIAMYCAMVVAGRSDDQTNMENNEGDDDMFLKKQICPRCKTGKYTYDLDPKSETCPYIGCWRRNKCHFYKPLEKAVNVNHNGLSNCHHIIKITKNYLLCICGFIVHVIRNLSNHRL